MEYPNANEREGQQCKNYDGSRRKSVRSAPSEGSDDYEKPADWTIVPDGTVTSVVNTLERERTPYEKPPITKLGTVVHGKVVGNAVNLGGNVICNKEQAKYISEVNNATRTSIMYDVRASYGRLLHSPSQDFTPRFLLTGLGCSGASCSTLPGANEEVNLQHIHEHCKRHAFLVSGPGGGKTIAAKRYAGMVLEGAVSHLKDVEMVHFIDASRLDAGRECRPFDLLFSHQLGGCITDCGTAHAGEEWMKRNPHKTLIVFDGLDKVEQDGPTGNIALSTKARPFTIILNLFRGKIYGGMWILSTSRYNWILKFPRKELPMVGVEIQGFPGSSAKLLLLQLLGSPKKRAVENVIFRYPAILDLCEIPMFLLCLAKILSQTSTSFGRDVFDIFQHEIALKLIADLQTSEHGSTWTASVFQSVMALAYESAKADNLTLNRMQVEEKSQIVLPEQILASKPDPQQFEGTQERLTDYQMRYTFRSELLRDMLAALHIMTRDFPEFKRILNNAFRKREFPNVLSLVHGATTDEKQEPTVVRVTESKLNFSKHRSFLKKTLNAQLSKTIQDTQTLHLLNDGKSLQSVFRDRLPSEISLSQAANACDSHAALSVLHAYPRIKRCIVRNLTIHSTSLCLVREQRAFQVENLSISGELSPSDMERLWTLIKNNPEIKQSCTTEHRITYTRETQEVLVEDLKSDDVDLLKSFLRNAPGTTRVILKTYRISGKDRPIIAELKELEELSEKFAFKVETLATPTTIKGTGETLFNMLIKNNHLVARADIGGVLISAKKDIQGHRLIVDGPLVDSDMLVDIFNEYQWMYIESEDFLIRIAEDRNLTVEEEYETKPQSYISLCKFMVKLRFSRLECSHIMLEARYLSEKLYKVIFGVRNGYTTDGDDFIGFCRFLLSLNACFVKFINLEMVPLFEEEETLTLKISHILGEQLSLLDLMLSASKIGQVLMAECDLTHPAEDLEHIREIAGKTNLRIEHLNVCGDMFLFMAQVYEMKPILLYEKATIGRGKEVASFLSSSEVSVSHATTHAFIEFMKDWLPLVKPGTILYVLQLQLGQHSISDIDDILDVLKAAERNVTTKINKLVVREEFTSAIKSVLDLSRNVHVGLVATENVEFQVEYGAERKVKHVSLDDVAIEDLDISFWREQKVEKLSIVNCRMHSSERREVQRSMTLFIDLMTQNFCLCTVNTLHVNVSLPDVIEQIMEPMLSGKLRSATSHGGTTLTRDHSRKTFSLVISKANAGELESMINEIPVSLDEILLEKCDAGARGQAHLIDRISSAPDIPSDMLLTVMDFTRSMAQRKVDEHILLLQRFADQYSHRKIKKLNINGNIEYFGQLLTLMTRLSISLITSQNAMVASDPDGNENSAFVMLEYAGLDETDSLEFILNSDCKVNVKRFHLGQLEVEPNRSKFAAASGLFQRETMQVDVVEATSSLADISRELLFLLEHAKPSKIVTRRYEIDVQFQQSGKIYLFANDRENGSFDSHKVFTDFSKQAGAEFTIRENSTYELLMNTQPKEVFQYEETTPKEVHGTSLPQGAADESSYYSFYQELDYVSMK